MAGPEAVRSHQVWAARVRVGEQERSAPRYGGPAEVCRRFRRPYRLEMNSKLQGRMLVISTLTAVPSVSSQGATMYDVWGDSITDVLGKACGFCLSL